MGFNYQLVAIPRERVEALYASRDDELFARMAAPQHRYAAHLLKSGDETMREALRCMLVGGDPTLPGLRPHQLGYAVEACCFELGEPLGEMTSNDVMRVDDVLGEVGLFPGVSEVWPMPIPDSDDVPLVGFLSTGDVAERRALLATKGDSEAVTLALQLFEKAERAGTDVVVFFH